MQRYPDIADHGLIGDLQTAALVSTDGTIDWFCAPRFDSPSIFASLLDADKGGKFRIGPIEQEYVTKQMYVPGSAVLVTRFLAQGGVVEVVDFMPISDETQTVERHRLCRLVRVVRGEMRIAMEVEPRFDYGRKKHTLDLSDDGGVARSESGETLTVHRVALPGRSMHEEGTSVERYGEGDVRLIKTLKAGEVAGLVLEYGVDHATPVSPEEMKKLYNDTVAWWNRWLARSTYHGRWQEMVTRSAMTLKLMQYAPTGAIVAAPTAGLPEQVGGERNWDYRYTWIRDSSFSIYALLGLGYVDEAAAFLGWLKDRVTDQQVDGSGPLKIMYRVDGSSDLKEETLTHWEGYRKSYPVRIGNDASGQLQLDIYGEAMDSIHLADRRGLEMGYDGWQQLTKMLDWLVDNWDRPDEGIWETRGGRKDFTYGRFMSWVAFDRAIRLAEEHGKPGDVDKWIRQRDTVYQQVMRRAWDEQRQAFVQSYGSDTLDASLLLMPLLGFVSPTEPRWTSTLDAIGEVLVSDSLVYRYDPEASPDGLRGSEGTFSLCTFFYVDALARAGRLDDSRLTLEKMFTYANHLGLFAEEIGLTGEQLGNFPQAFSHLALINAAIDLDAEINQETVARAAVPLPLGIGR